MAWVERYRASGAWDLGQSMWANCMAIENDMMVTWFKCLNNSVGPWDI